MKKPFKQTEKVGRAGSLINQMMGNNSSIPEVGKGATELHYTDRSCYEVIEVSEDKMTVKVEALSARYNDQVHKNGTAPMGHQDWILEPTGHFSTIVWKYGGWKKVSKPIVFTKELNAKYEAGYRMTDEEIAKVYGAGEDAGAYPKYVVPGLTRQATRYTKIRIIFGVKDYHYDWSF